MTLRDVRGLLESRRIEYSIFKYEKEADFLKHIHKFPDLSFAEDCKTLAVVIKCNNRVKDIEIQFNKIDGEYYFVELMFGEFCFELIDDDEEYMALDLMSIIYQVLSEQIAIIVKNDLKKQKWISDSCFNLAEDNPVFGEPAFIRAVQSIQIPKSPIESKLSSKKQYEIYTANSYQCIVK